MVDAYYGDGATLSEVPVAASRVSFWNSRGGQAVEAKIEEQAEFVEWLGEKVRGNTEAYNADPRHFVEQAKHLRKL